MTTTNFSPDVAAYDALDVLRDRILVDGFEIVIDLHASHGSHLHDAVTGREYLDFYSFFASMPLSFNHPRLREPEFQAKLLTASTTRVANADVYSSLYARFVQALSEIAAPPGFKHFFFIDGGGLAVENALKVAFDWKVRKNIAAGRGEIGSQVIHFRRAFHGRTGYTLSLTDSPDPRKTMYFPQFDWPRVSNPMIDFSLPEPQRTEDVAAREAQSVAEIEAAIEQHGHDIACLIIEPIQGEGGDNHFRPEFLARLREICDQHEIMLIFDEVQTGTGLTGTMWAFEQLGAVPDVFSFGKKMQQCGIMAGPRVDEVENCFTVPSRINSTWGGSLTDMVRATQCLKVIHEEKLLEHVQKAGAFLLDGLHRLAEKYDEVTAARGRGLMCAFDVATPELRDAIRHEAYENNMMILICGDRSLRFRPVLDVTMDDLGQGIEILDASIGAALKK